MRERRARDERVEDVVGGSHGCDSRAGQWCGRAGRQRAERVQQLVGGDAVRVDRRGRLLRQDERERRGPVELASADAAQSGSDRGPS